MSEWSMREIRAGVRLSASVLTIVLAILGGGVLLLGLYAASGLGPVSRAVWRYQGVAEMACGHVVEPNTPKNDAWYDCLAEHLLNSMGEK